MTGPRGVQPKLKLKIETFVGLPETTNLSLSKLIDRIILRPLSSALALSACASHAVTDAGAGRLSVTATSTHGVLAAREQATRLANRHCGRNAQRAVVESFEDQRLGGVIGDPTSTLVFTCGASNTTALSR